MDLGFVGLGRMGGNMVERLLRGGHRVWAFTTHIETHPEAVQRFTSAGGTLAHSLQEVAKSLSAPRFIWLMIPSGRPVDEAIETLIPDLQQGDTVIDGGNSNYKDSQRRAASLAAKGIHFVDVGTSGGIGG